MFARLPMYDRRENSAAHDALWAGVRSVLGYGSAHLDRETDYVDGWGRDDLLLGQMCNLPYRAQFRDQVSRIGCADYGLPDTPAGYYHSVFVVRKDEAARGLAPATLGRFAYSDALSQSGWGAPLAMVAAKGLKFHTTLRTGSHIDSMLAVAAGRADLAAIDGVTWRMLQAWEPRAAEVCVIDRTAASPGMTFVTANTNDPEPIRAALCAAIADLAPDHAETLGMIGLAVLPDRAYDIALPTPP
jgi:ABC-type phosphate/phosphonate transport system substrate-binding protein